MRVTPHSILGASMVYILSSYCRCLSSTILPWGEDTVADIFISHVEEDVRLAIDIAHAIESMGFVVWYYERDTVPGPSYLLQVGEAIDVCSAVILLISSHALGSFQVTQEVIRAYESNKPFVPLLIDVSHGEFQTRQPQWRAALGATASLKIPPEGIGSIIPQIAKGLSALGIRPAAHDTRVMASLVEAQDPEPLPAAQAEAQRQQTSEHGRSQELQEQRDRERYKQKPHSDTPLRCSPRPFSFPKTCLLVSGGIAIVLIMFFLARTPQPPQLRETQSAGRVSVDQGVQSDIPPLPYSDIDVTCMSGDYVNSDDDWTSRPLVMALLPLEIYGTASPKSGEEDVLWLRFADALQAKNITLVERDLLDKILAELKQMASEGKPETSICVGRILAARLMGVGSLIRDRAETRLSVRVVDTETTAIQATASTILALPLEREDIADQLVSTLTQQLRNAYPLQGRILETTDNDVRLNIGADHGVTLGLKLQVFQEEDPSK
jgi:TIR domain-containing protein